LGESYTGIHTLADFSVIVIYTNWPSGIVAFLVATLESSNNISDAVAGDINLVATLVSVNKLSGVVAGDNLVATLASVNKLFGAVAGEQLLYWCRAESSVYPHPYHHISPYGFQAYQSVFGSNKRKSGTSTLIITHRRT
jgi:hypothetical protein